MPMGLKREQLSRDLIQHAGVVAPHVLPLKGRRDLAVTSPFSRSLKGVRRRTDIPTHRRKEVTDTCFNTPHLSTSVGKIREDASNVPPQQGWARTAHLTPEFLFI